MQGHAREKLAREAAEEQLRLERRARKDAAELARQTRESVEKQLGLAEGKVTRLEADLHAALGRATRAEAQRDVSERARASAFIDGYEELRRKASVAYPYNDLSALKPSEAPISDDEDYVSGGSEGH